MAWWLRCWIPNPGVPGSKSLSSLSSSKVDSTFHFSEMDEIGPRYSWGLSIKK